MSNIDTEEDEDNIEDGEYTEEEEYTENEKDRSALLAFYKSSGMEQHFPDRWNINEPYWNWFGIETSNDDRVTKLCCEGGLEGEIPPEIGDLSEMDPRGIYPSVVGGAQCVNGLPFFLAPLPFFLAPPLKIPFFSPSDSFFF